MSLRKYYELSLFSEFFKKVMSRSLLIATASASQAGGGFHPRGQCQEIRLEGLDGFSFKTILT